LWINDIHAKLDPQTNEDGFRALVRLLAMKFASEDVHIFVSIISYGANQETMRSLVEQELLNLAHDPHARKERIERELDATKTCGPAGSVDLGANPHESCTMVVATKPPLESRQLVRLAKRAILGLARAGGSGENGSGDYVIAFSTTNRFPAQSSGGASAGPGRLSEDQLSPLFETTIEGARKPSMILL
jgi:L-aminopeptidase/D-esterase-like protein